MGYFCTSVERNYGSVLKFHYNRLVKLEIKILKKLAETLLKDFG